MMLRRMALLALALSLTTVAWGQGKPDFSGTWRLGSAKARTLDSFDPNNPVPPTRVGFVNTSCGVRPDEPRPPANCGSYGVPSQSLIITQSASEITVEGTHFGLGPGQKVVYKLDGSDTIWQAPWVTHSGSSKVVKWRSRARWEGNTLVLYTWNLAERHLQLRDALSLSGGQLTIIRFVEQGAPGLANGTVTYTRVS
jgi:hypothetical protein